jgi:hypothetical protein
LNAHARGFRGQIGAHDWQLGPRESLPTFHGPDLNLLLYWASFVELPRNAPKDRLSPCCQAFQAASCGALACKETKQLQSGWAKA